MSRNTDGGPKGGASPWLPASQPRARRRRRRRPLRAVQDLCDRGEATRRRSCAASAQAGRDAAFDSRGAQRPAGARMDLAVKRGAARSARVLTCCARTWRVWTPGVKRELPVARRARLPPDRDTAPTRSSSTARRSPRSSRRRPSRPSAIRKGLRWYADLPFRDELPAELVPAAGAPTWCPVTHIDDISWVGGRLRVTGFAYLAGLSVRSRRFNRATVVLRGPRWLPPVRLRTRRVLAPRGDPRRARARLQLRLVRLHRRAAARGPLRWRGAVRAVVRGAQAAACAAARRAGHHHVAGRDRDLEPGRAGHRPAARPLHRPHRASRRAASCGPAGGSGRSGPPTAPCRSCSSPTGPS